LNILTKEKIVTTVQLIAMTLYLEAGNQGHDGIVAVASVIWNSAANNSTEAIEAEILTPHRYSCWNGRKPSVKVISMFILRGRLTENPAAVLASWQDCIDIAIAMEHGQFKPTLTATHYHVETLRPPFWSRKAAVIRRIGKHIFYKV
jgi:Cell wall hydrolyses involved in spore germination